MSTTASQPNPSSLSDIRQVEVEMAQKIAEASARSDEMIRQAESQAKAILKEVHSKNQQIRQLKHQHIIASSTAEAQAMIEQAKLRAEDIHQNAKAHIEAAVDFAVSYVLGETSGKELP